MNEKPFIQITNLTVKKQGVRVLDNISLSMYKGQQWAILGPSGSGKTTFGQALAGSVFFSGSIQFGWLTAENAGNEIILVGQQHRFKNLSNTSEFYYQQRFNSQDAGNSISVAETLSPFVTDAKSKVLFKSCIGLLHLEGLLEKPLIQLSNGENKRVQLAVALLATPRILILDSPFTGLDVEGRKTLTGILDRLSADGMQLVLITTPADLPQSTTHIAILENGKLIQQGRKADLDRWHPGPAQGSNFSVFELASVLRRPADDFQSAVRMNNVSVKYGSKTILENINWEIKKGECWNLSGENGAGKSTLLSLINADNPQAYSNEIFLFDKRRGKGESIWDIKKRIGYVSPELHLFFDQYSSCFDIVASGLFDTIGLFRTLHQTESEQVAKWIKIGRIERFAEKPLFSLSLGEQRMVLLVRALVKNPALLILDEPCQGLDELQTTNFISLVDAVCTAFHSSLIYVSHYDNIMPRSVTKHLKLKNGKQISGWV